MYTNWFDVENLIKEVGEFKEKFPEFSENMMDEDIAKILLTVFTVDKIETISVELMTTNTKLADLRTKVDELTNDMNGRGIPIRIKGD